MNTDIRLSVGFWQHPKTRKMEKNLGIKGVRSLQILWAWVAQNRSDGELSGMDWEDIELAADWRGRKGAFFNYCLGIWIDGEDGAYSIHDWKEHNEWASEDEERRDKARFSRLAKVNPQAFEKLRLQGINAISKDGYKRLTDVERPFDDPLTNVERPFDDCLTPSPSPAPDIKKLNTPPYPPEGGGEGKKTQKPSGKKQNGNTLAELQAQMRACTDNPGLLKTLEDFRLMRERIRKPLTGRGLELILEKLSILATDDPAKIAILEQSILNSW